MTHPTSGDAPGITVSPDAQAAATRLASVSPLPTHCGELLEALRAAAGVAGVEVELATERGAVVVARAGTTVAANDSATSRRPLADAEGQVLGTLRSHGGEVPEEFAVIGAAFLHALEIELLRADAFDAEDRADLAEATFVEAAGQLVHDLNNPLAASSMSLEIALDETQEPLVRQLLERAVNGTTRMKKMVVDLLTYSANSTPGRGEVAPAARRVGETFRESAEIDVDWDVDEQLPSVALRTSDLEVVLTELLANAVKFSGDGPATVRILASQDDAGAVHLSIDDAGVGVPSEDLERIFTPTVRLDRKIPGMGLGLPAVRRSVENVGGRVLVAPSPAGGLRVTLVLPVAAA